MVVGPAQLQRHKVVQFADLVLAGVAFGMLDSVPAIGGRPVPLGRQAVSDTASAEAPVPENGKRHGWIDRARRASRIGQGQPVSHLDRHGAR
jgi:hypothetical protein